MSKLPDLFEAYAIERPSGENVGSVWSPGSNVSRVRIGVADARSSLGPGPKGRRPFHNMPAVAASAANTRAPTTTARRRSQGVAFALIWVRSDGDGSGSSVVPV